MKFREYLLEAKEYGGMAGMGGIFRDLTKNREDKKSPQQQKEL